MRGEKVTEEQIIWWEQAKARQAQAERRLEEKRFILKMTIRFKG